ncbi:ankyrin repeat-containing protein [Sclerotinia borealis F-4128]|uniref:Ankyrin repeat-containing protein n=1 Tax=Sclerotinia borealis (strain F-4128) TaxID=1432307 RepID=W9CSA0_SCLBF|nr:ankyrin repeat-containing protein [Sclerotinia borealis F-4128]
MRSWIRRHVHRDKTGRSDWEHQSKWAQSKWAGWKAGVMGDVLSSSARPIISGIESKPVQKPSAMLSLTALSVISTVERDSNAVLEPSTLSSAELPVLSGFESKPHWKVRVGNTTVEVKTALNNIVKAAQYAQSFIGTVVSGEPHAALAWAGVSLFLPVGLSLFLYQYQFAGLFNTVKQLLINASEQPKDLVKGVDYISRILCQVSVIERMYQEQIAYFPLATATRDTAKLFSKFEEDLTNFYAKILQYQCRASYQLNSTKATRVARDMIRLDNWDGLLTEPKEHEAACDSSRIEGENRCIQNFYVSAYEKQMNRNSDAIKGTCHWLIDHPNFAHWKDSESSSLLWVSAGPGCGKSVVSRMLIKMLSEKRPQPAKSRTVCYFFKEDDDSQRTVENALCAILHQILTAPGNSKLDVGHIEKYCARSISGGNHLHLDALDECEDTSRYMLIDTLREFHRDCIENSNSISLHLKILVTSRPYTGIERRFKALTGKFPTIRLSGDEESAKISKEIDLVIEEEVKRLRNYNSKQLRGICLMLLKNFHKQVDQAYEAILNRIPKGELGRAKKLLSIVVAAERPLHVQEMNVALAVDEEPTQNSLSSLDIESEANFRATLGNICGLFVTVVDSKVYLIHQTARSFLLSNHETPQDMIDNFEFKWKGSVHRSAAHLLLGKICVNYLLFRDYEQEPPFFKLKQWNVLRETDCGKQLTLCFTGATQKHSLAIYASQNWGLHIQQTNVVENTALSNARYIVEELDCFYPLAIAVNSGIEFMVRRALESQGPSDIQCRQALCQAIRLEHTKAVQMILEDRKLEDLHAPLLTAIGMHRFDLVRLLIKYGAGEQDLYQEALDDATDTDFGDFGEAILYREWVAYFGYPFFQLVIAHCDERALAYLISLGLNPDGLLYDHETPLTWAVCCRQPTMVRALIEHGVDVNGSKLGGCNPISQALLLADSDLNIQRINDNDNISPKFLNSMWEHDCIIATLLVAGAKTTGLSDLESNALSEFHHRQKKRRELGICTDTGLDLQKLANRPDLGST